MIRLLPYVLPLLLISGSALAQTGPFKTPTGIDPTWNFYNSNVTIGDIETAALGAVQANGGDASNTKVTANSSTQTLAALAGTVATTTTTANGAIQRTGDSNISGMFTSPKVNLSSGGFNAWVWAQDIQDPSPYGTNGPQYAHNGMQLKIFKGATTSDWYSSTQPQTGELDGINVTLRQAGGSSPGSDASAILTDIGCTTGAFCNGWESAVNRYAVGGDGATPLEGLDTQVGVINSYSSTSTIIGYQVGLNKKATGSLAIAYNANGNANWDYYINFGNGSYVVDGSGNSTTAGYMLANSGVWSYGTNATLSTNLFAGTGELWNISGAGTGESDFINLFQGGKGGYNFYSAQTPALWNSGSRNLLAYIDSVGDVVSEKGSIGLSGIWGGGSTVPDAVQSHAGILWNLSGGQGEGDFVDIFQGGSGGGYNFYTSASPSNFNAGTRTLLASIDKNGNETLLGGINAKLASTFVGGVTADNVIATGNITVAGKVALDSAGTFWVQEISGKVIIGTGTTHLFSIDGSGNVIAAGTISAKGTP